jgi:hypothetical protein
MKKRAQELHGQGIFMCYSGHASMAVLGMKKHVRAPHRQDIFTCYSGHASTVVIGARRVQTVQRVAISLSFSGHASTAVHGIVLHVQELLQVAIFMPCNGP